MRLLALAVLATALLAAPNAGAALVTRPVGAKPLSDAAAAKLVERSSFEPRPGNRKALRRTPTTKENS